MLLISMPTCLDSEQIVNSADDNIYSGCIASLCSQVVLELCVIENYNILANRDRIQSAKYGLPAVEVDSLLYI